MARHDRRATRAELRPPPSRLPRGGGGGLRWTALDIPSVDDPCSAHSRHVPRSIAGLRSLNAIISTRVRARLPHPTDLVRDRAPIALPAATKRNRLKSAA